MEKVTDGLILVILCLFLFIGCQNNPTEEMRFENVANASKIEVSHFYEGEESKQTIENSDAINEIANWLNTFILNKVSFPEGENPEENENRESFCFIVYNEAETTITEFCYVIDLEQCYIRYQSQWYIVENPSIPTFT